MQQKTSESQRQSHEQVPLQAAAADGDEGVAW